MNSNWIEHFKALPFEKKEEVFHAMCVKAEKDNDGAKINRIEKSLTRVLTKTWQGTSTKAINKALKLIPNDTKRFSKKDADKILASLTKSYKGIEKKTKKRVEDDTEEIYKTEKVSFGKKFKLDKKKKTLIFQGLKLDPLHKTIVDDNRVVKSFDWNRVKKNKRDVFKAVEFGLIDTAAFTNLARLENVAIGDHFPIVMKPKVSKLLDTALERGLNHADTSVFLEQELTKTLGGNISQALPASVAQGQASSAAYFEMLTATNVTYARNFAHVNLMTEGGITRVVFDAILDRTTSQICEQMNGREFTIEQAVIHQQKVLDAENVAELKLIAPFTRTISAKASSAELAAAGVLIPPLHGKCRSEINPA